MKTILVTAATEMEISALIGEAVAVQDVCGFSVHSLTLPGKRVVFAATGMGKVNAALCTAALVCSLSPSFLVNTGCAGAYRESGFSVGDVVLADSEIYGDEGVLTAAGWKSLDFIGIPLVDKDNGKLFNELPLSLPLREKALAFAASTGFPLRRGKFVTVSTCSGLGVRGDELAERFGAVCENMEGAAVAHVALRFGLEFLEIRGISNMVEDRDMSRWDIPAAAENAQSFLKKLLEFL